MNDEDRLHLYKELYAAQNAERERIENQLQTIFAIELALLSGLAYLVTSVVPEFTKWASTYYWTVVALAALTIGASVYYFIRAYWGHTYQMMPVATEIEQYKEDLVATYQGYEDGEAIANGYFRSFLISYFSTWSSYNTTVNDYRAVVIHRCLGLVITSLLPMLISLALLTFADIDKLSDETVHKVQIQERS